MTQCAFCGGSQSDRPDTFKPYLLQCQVSDGGSCSPCTRINQLESQIQEAMRALDLMLQQHRELKTQINRVHDPITQRLPSEIVSYIFQFYVLCASKETRGVNQSEATAPFILGAVCQHWRQIVWTTPQLWTSIQVDFGASDLESCYDSVRQRLALSGGLPLSFHIQIPRIPNYATDLDSLGSRDTVNSLLELINLYSSRWGLLDLSIPSALFSHFCGNSHSPSVSVLRTLRLQSRLMRGGDGKFSIQNLKPRPEFVFLSDFRIKAVDIFWDNVSQVELVRPKLSECFELFMQALRLRSCKLDRIIPDFEGQPLLPIDTILHHQLKVLYVSSSFTMDPFLAKVTFPALEELSCNSKPECIPTATLISLFNRSSSLLRRLHIESASMRDENLFLLLEAVPSLRRLEINPRRANYSPNNFFDCLARTSLSNDSHGKENNGRFLPELQFFRFWTGHEISFKPVPGIFGPLSELHNPRRRPLHTLQIYIKPKRKDTVIYIDKEVIPHIVAVLEARLNLEILHVNNPNQSPDLIKASMEYHGMADK